jgi:hypothetical protein
VLFLVTMGALGDGIAARVLQGIGGAILDAVNLGPHPRYVPFRRVFKNSEGGSEENPSEEPSF